MCERCGKELTGKQTRWCSEKCSKLGLKNEWRKKNKEKVNEYNRKWKRLGIRGNPSTNKVINTFLKRNPQCAKCGSIKDLQVGHIKPRVKGGQNRDNLITLCRLHHYQFDQALKEFWKEI